MKKLDGVDAVTPVVQATAYLKSGKYISMVKLYGLDLTTADQFLLTPEEGTMPGEGLRFKPEVMLTDDVAASFADPNQDWRMPWMKMEIPMWIPWGEISA